jgi:hypothetical protein
MDDFFPLKPIRPFATRGLVGRDEFLGLLPGASFDLAAFGKGDSLSKRDAWPLPPFRPQRPMW